MKSKDKIINEAIHDLAEYTGFSSMRYRSAVRTIISKAMKEQDRNTRHACAEAVLACPELNGGVISKDEAHNRVMNTPEA